MSNHEQFSEKLGKSLIFIFASISLVILLSIVFFIFRDGFLAFKENGFFHFIFGSIWSVQDNTFSILPLIVGSLVVTLGALLVSIPIGFSCAVFLAEIAPEKVRNIVKPAIDILVGIPSVVFGLLGMILLVPYIRDNYGGPGLSLLAGIVVLILMILPTIIAQAEDSIRSVPPSYKNASLALGATHLQTIWNVILPCAKSGLVSSVMLASGRAIGEAMAVYMVIGNTFTFPKSLIDPSRTLTSNIVGQIEEATVGGAHLHALFGCGLILLFIVFVLNSYSFFIKRRGCRSC